jgi:hypothetical protein
LISFYGLSFLAVFASMALDVGKLAYESLRGVLGVCRLSFYIQLVKHLIGNACRLFL